MAEEAATDGSSNTIVVGEDGQAAEDGLPADRRRERVPTQDTAPDDSRPSPGTGSGTQPVEAPPESVSAPADDPAPDAPVPAARYELDPDDPADEPLEVKADEDDPGLLEQVAEAMGGLWDDAKDVAT